MRPTKVAVGGFFYPHKDSGMFLLAGWMARLVLGGGQYINRETGVARTMECNVACDSEAITVVGTKHSERRIILYFTRILLGTPRAPLYPNIL